MFQETQLLTVNSTGTGTWNFYGGNQNGGNLAGNPTIVINNTRSGLNTLSGGANIGTVTGNTSLVVNDSGGRIASIYGAVMGPTQPTQRMLLVTSQQRLRLRMLLQVSN